MDPIQFQACRYPFAMVAGQHIVENVIDAEAKHRGNDKKEDDVEHATQFMPKGIEKGEGYPYSDGNEQQLIGRNV